MRQFALPCAIALLLGVPLRPAEAAEAAKTPGRLLVVHRDGLVRNQTYKADWRDITLEPEMGIQLRSREVLTVIIQDPNPLLFTYTWNGVTEAPTQDYQHGLKFAEVLGNLATTLQGAEAAARVAKASPGPRAPTLSGINDQIKLILDNAGLSPTSLADFQQDVKDLSDRLSLIPSLIDQSAGDRAAVGRVKSTVAGWDLGAVESRIRQTLKNVNRAENQLLQITAGHDKQELIAFDARLLTVLLAKDRETEIDTSLITLKNFAKDVNRIDVPLTLGTFAYSPDLRRTATFTIQPVEANAQAAIRSKRLTGAYAFDATPFSPVQVGFGAAAVYSFVEKPEFAVETVEDELRIVRKDDGKEYTAQSVAAMLTLTPRAWSDPTFGGHFQIGINPSSDELALYLGAALRIQKYLHFGLGWTFQEVPKLADGLSLSRPLTAASEFKTDTEFKSGFYLSFTVATK